MVPVHGAVLILEPLHKDRAFHSLAVDGALEVVGPAEVEDALQDGLVLHADVDGVRAGGNCIKIGLPGKLILSKRKGLWEVLFS